MKHLNVSVLCYLLLFEMVNADHAWNYFNAKESFDDKICNNADLLFKNVLDRSKMECLIKCMDHGNCASVFVHETGLCAGCGVIYDDTAFKPTEVMKGTKYYEKQNIEHHDVFHHSNHFDALVLDCPTGWATSFASCYFLVEEAMNFEEGVDKCQQLNAHAVKIKDESENDDIKEFLSSMTHKPGDWGFFTAYKNDTSGNWTSYDFSHTITFDNWLSDEPSYDVSENCLTYILQFALKWMDSPCNGDLRMICEIDRI